MENIPCARCHRALKNAKSIEVGMGRSCYKKYLAEKEKENETEMDKE